MTVISVRRLNDLTKVKVFSDQITTDVASEVASFLNITKGIQILDISWFVKYRMTICVITYFEV
jgi:hypothetical protein